MPVVVANLAAAVHLDIELVIVIYLFCRVLTVYSEAESLMQLTSCQIV